MPGMAGAVRTSPEIARRLIAEFRQVWPSASDEFQGSAVLAAHAHQGCALFDLEPGWKGAVDGEWSLYRDIGESEATGRLFDLSDRGMELSQSCHGNVALIAPDGDTVHLATEWSGTFPLYYTSIGGGFLFSSHLRPLRAAVELDPDPQGVIEFLREGYTTCGRTAAREIRRLQPGQALTFRNGSATISERSRAWAGPARQEHTEALEERAYDLLLSAARDALPHDEPAALMMSAGWDSRTLLAVLQSAGDRVVPYSHGDVGGRELRLVERMCHSRGLDARLEPIDARVYDPERLRGAFTAVETAVFPHWLRAGHILASTAASVVTAGVYGEILGGHYGSGMVRSGLVGKAMEFARGALGRSAATPSPDPGDALERLRPNRLGIEWCLRDDFIGDPQVRLSEIERGVEQDLSRLRRRGVEAASRLLEAYISEHRGTQYISAQLLACRGAIDVAAPFTHRDLLVFASRIPVEAKIHNRLNKQVLARRAPDLLEFPTAATLAAADSSLLIQEASRAARKLYEAMRWQAYFRTNGRLAPPRLGWVNFEFLRHGDSLFEIVEDLRLDFWDRDSLRRRLKDSLDLARGRSMHPIYDMINKIHTVDLLLRDD